MGAILDTANQVWRDFRRWSASFPLPIGDPRSGPNPPAKSEIRGLFSTVDSVVAAKADLNSPSFTGAPVAPDPASNDNSQRVPTTAWVLARIAAQVLGISAGNVAGPGAASIWQRAAWDNTAGTLLRAGNVLEPIDRIADVPTLDLLGDDLAAVCVGSRLSTGTYYDHRGVLSTAAVNVPRVSYDPATLLPNGLLLEPASTNVLLQSNDINQAAWLKSGGAASTPGGTEKGLTIQRFTINAGTSVSQCLSQLRTKSAAAQSWTAWTIIRVSSVPFLHLYIDANTTSNSCRAIIQTSNWSVFSTTNFGTFSAGLSTVRDLGGGWYLIGVSGTTGTETSLRLALFPSNSSGTVTWSPTGSEYFETLHLQLEQMPFPTSAIITTSAEVTRAADLFSIPVSSEWFNAVEGTLFVEFAQNATIYPNNNLSAVSLNNGTFQNSISVRSKYNSAYYAANIIVSGAQSFEQLQPATTSFVSAAIAYKTNDAAASFNGIVPSTDVTVSIPTITEVHIGREGNWSHLNGFIRRVVYWPRRLSNDKLSNLTRR